MTRPDPMADGTLAALAARVEAEEPSRALWGEVFFAVTTPEEHNIKIRRFNMFVTAGAYLDAADMLMPPYMNSSLEMNWSGKPMAVANVFPIDPIDPKMGKQLRLSVEVEVEVEAEAYEPHAEARARLAAALRARDAGGT